MPTIAELLAAKQAKGKPAAAPRESRGAAEPPNVIVGKDEAWTVRRQKAASGGLKIRKGETLEDKAPPEPPPADERRSLSTTCGEDFAPIRQPSQPDEIAWDSALQALDTELCIMPDSDPRNERAWVAIRRPDRPGEPLFLFALPMFPNPHERRDPSEPF